MGTLNSDFIGFTFNNVPSSSLGIKHVSNGSRFSESLLPTMQDKVVQVPGGDGSYYFDSYYTQRSLIVQIAFDSITEEQIRRMRQLFGDKKIHELVFDEAPYKIYQAKVTGMATINYIPFGEGPQNRVYKGEGEIQFTVFNPYAICKNKYLDCYIKKDSSGHPIDKDGNIIDYGKTIESQAAAKKKEIPIANRQEWAAASGMLHTQGKYDKISNRTIFLYNPGDVPSDWKMEFNFKKGILGTAIPNFSLRIDDKVLNVGNLSPLGQDTSIVVNSKNNLIEGYCSDGAGRKIKSGNIYNQYIISGDFFKIPCNRYSEDGSIISPQLVIDGGSEIINSLNPSPIEYNYYYL